MPDSSRQHPGPLCRGQNVYRRNIDVDSHRVDLIFKSVVGFIGYSEVFGGLTRGSAVVLDDDSEGARWKAVLTNLSEPAALGNSKKNLGEYNS